MKRALFALFILLGLALPMLIVVAQPPPPGTPPPLPTSAVQSTPFGPPVDNNAPPGISGSTQQATVVVTSVAPPIDQTAPVQVQETPIVITPEPTVDPGLGVDAVDPADPIPVLIRVRADINTLLESVLGVGQTPEGWSDLTTTDIDDPQAILLTRLDLEILAGLIAGSESRPAGWFGANASSDFAIVRDIRHDLELLADIQFNGDTRPTGWNGDDPLFRCSRSTQTLVRLLEINGLFTVEIDPQATNYCAEIESAASRFAEVNLLANPLMNGSLTGSGTLGNGGAYTVTSDFAVAFADRGASQRLGVIPNGTMITPLARSYAQFSNMTLVRGENFEVYVDYQFTDLPPEVFEELEDVSLRGSSPFCEADWCGG